VGGHSPTPRLDRNLPLELKGNDQYSRTSLPKNKSSEGSGHGLTVMCDQNPLCACGDPQHFFIAFPRQCGFVCSLKVDERFATNQPFIV
jgi:hypothetical protein